MNIIISIFGALFALSVLVMLHEFGHFWVARRCGIRVERFSLGFGKPLWSRTAKDGVEYRLGWLPLGGYVKMYGDEVNEDGEAKCDDPDSYHSKSVWARMAVVLAGPMMNFLIALLIFVGLFMSGMTRTIPVVGKVKPNSIAATAGIKPNQAIIELDGMPARTWLSVRFGLLKRYGQKNATIQMVMQDRQGRDTAHLLHVNHWHMAKDRPDLIGMLGITAYTPKLLPLVHKVVPGSPAANSGLKAGDKILAMNGKPINNWLPLAMYTQSHPGGVVDLRVERAGLKQNLTVPIAKTYDMKLFKNVGSIGVLPPKVSLPSWMIKQDKYSFLGSWVPALKQTWGLIDLNIVTIKKIVTDQISLKVLSGPITVFYIAGKSTLLGLKTYLSFLAFISAALGFMNLLPVPGLDGGHFLFQVIEAGRGKAVSFKWQGLAMQFGLILLVLLMLQATWNDLFRIF